MILSVDRKQMLSVVMPSLNQGQYISSAIRSVLEQETADLELIVADGGSTDDTIPELEELQDAFPGRIRWFSHADGGPAQAVNAALQLAGGEFIGWLNADDMYAPGAVNAAMQAFSEQPRTQMVYGEAQWIDHRGEPLGPYPTRSPDAGIAGFQEGCYVCQPTAFLRRSVFAEIGGLDESLQTAFDFDLWLRLFRHCPHGVRALPRIQASSRRHGRSITSMRRRDVMRESMSVLARHLGHAKPHWIFTLLEEWASGQPSRAPAKGLREDMAEFMAEVRGFLTPSDLELANAQLNADRRISLSLPGVTLGIHADGWAGPDLRIRIRCQEPGRGRLVLHCAAPAGSRERLKVTITSSDGVRVGHEVVDPAAFSMALDFPAPVVDALCTFRLLSSRSFTPSRHEPGSTDHRNLAFRILSATITYQG